MIFNTLEKYLLLTYLLVIVTSIINIFQNLSFKFFINLFLEIFQSELHSSYKRCCYKKRVYIYIFIISILHSFINRYIYSIFTWERTFIADFQRIHLNSNSWTNLSTSEQMYIYFISYCRTQNKPNTNNLQFFVFIHSYVKTNEFERKQKIRVIHVSL